jgi:cytochrome c peroxidase
MICLRYKTSVKVTIFLVAFTLFSCGKNGDITPIEDTDLLFYPDYFPEPHYNFENNPFSPEGFELGRKLFFDENLSSDKTISCASCHHQNFAFSDAGNPVSLGVENRLGIRNSPPIFNLMWHESFMWDGGVNHIEVMPIAPLTVHEEMDMDLNDIVDYLNAQSQYQKAFKDVFNASPINSQQLLHAFAQYMSGLISQSAKFDKVEKGTTTYSAIEQQGFNLFEAHCAACHTAPLFMDNDFHDNGIVTNPIVDGGRYEITLDNQDMGKFKTPSLRNVTLTYPYMHDGRFTNLEDVIEHYSNGITETDNLSPLLPVGGFGFSVEEKNALIAFLKTLTDWEFVYDNRFSE